MSVTIPKGTPWKDDGLKTGMEVEVMRRDERQGQLAFLFRKQGGKCHICGEPAILDYNGGKAGHGLSAVRFRLGSSFGQKGRVRPRVMAHRKCAQERSDQIQMSQDIDETRARSGRFPTEFYEMAKPTPQT